MCECLYPCLYTHPLTEKEAGGAGEAEDGVEEEKEEVDETTVDEGASISSDDKARELTCTPIVGKLTN